MFNALKYTEELKKAGFSREQAEASIKVLIEVMNDQFATKPDLKELEVALKSDMKGMESGIRSDMKEMESGLRSDMKEMESGLRSEIRTIDTKIETAARELDYRLTIKLGTMMTVAIGLTATLIKVLSLKA